MNTSKPSSRQSNRRSAQGFTLLEVMIALVVLSIGLLGVAALQGVGLRSSHGAYLGSQANLLAYDMADRIRANPQARVAYDAFDFDAIDCTQALPQTPLASADLAEWACAVAALLPAGRGTIASADSVAAIGAVVYTIQVEWQDQQVTVDADGDETPWTFTMVLEL